MLKRITRVLVVEDNPGDMLLLRESLKPHVDGQFDLVHENCLEDALVRLCEEEIDVILLDLFLPETMGLETLRMVRKAAPEIPVIIWTGFYHEETAFQALQLGAFCYLSKEGLNGKPLADALKSLCPRGQG